MVGYGLLFDPLLDYHLLTISSTFVSKFTELALPILYNTVPALHSRSSTKSLRTAKPATYLAYPFPDDSLLISPRKSVLQGLRIPLSVLRERDPLSTDAIKLLGEITVRIRNAVGSILRIGEGLRRRCPPLSPPTHPANHVQRSDAVRVELQRKELQAHLSKLSSTVDTITTLQTRLSAIEQTQSELESRANSLLRQLLTINHPLPSEAEEKWFKELARVKARLDRGLKTETKVRLAEGRKFLEIAGRRALEDYEIGAGRKVDGRVMEAIEEAYYPFRLGD